MAVTFKYFITYQDFITYYIYASLRNQVVTFSIFFVLQNTRLLNSILTVTPHIKVAACVPFASNSFKNTSMKLKQFHPVVIPM